MLFYIKYLKIFAELNKVYSSLNKVYFVLHNFRNMKGQNEANNLICYSSMHPTSINWPSLPGLWAYQVAQWIKNLPAMQCKRCRRHGFNPWVRKIPFKGTWQPTPSILAWRISWTEEPGRLQSMGSQRVRHDWSNWACTFQFYARHWEPSIITPKAAFSLTAGLWWSSTDGQTSRFNINYKF